MNTLNIEKLMSLFDITMDLPNQKQYAFKILDDNNFIDVNILKREIVEAIENPYFPWVDLGIKTKLVYTSDYYNPPSHKFSKVDLLYFLNSEIRFSFSEEIPSDDEMHRLNELISKTDIQEGTTIQDIFFREEFNWMKFGTKHKFLEKFGKDILENRDVICWLKFWCWEYLFPNSLSQFNKDKDLGIAISILKNHSENNGWLDCDVILREIAKTYPNLKVDEFYIENLKWGDEVQHKFSERTQFALGYRRFKNSF
jgi:hypothetical protein